MEVCEMETVKLNSGFEMPIIGLGTFLLTPDEAENSVYNALKSGYRLIDTANSYVNEKAVARGIKKSGVPREEIFLETKLWPAFYEEDGMIEKTLERLNTDYIDLLLLHQPAGNYMYAYKQMEKAVKEGKVRSLGLANFDEKQMKEIMEECEIKPAVLQTEAHPYFPQTEMKKFIAQYDIRLQAWYPLGHGDSTLINEPVLAEIGKKYGKTNAQIILRWHIQENNIIIPGARKAEHIQENIEIFDFSLTEEDMKKIATINKNERYYESMPIVLAGYAAFRPDIDSQK